MGVTGREGLTWLPPNREVGLFTRMSLRLLKQLGGWKVLEAVGALLRYVCEVVDE